MFRLAASRLCSASASANAARVQFARSARFVSTTSIYDEIMAVLRQDLKKNIRLKADPLEKNVIRSILTEVKNMEIANVDETQDEFKLYDLLHKMVKERNASAAEYMKEGSPDRFQQMGQNELREAALLSSYLDKIPISTQAEVDAKVRALGETIVAQGELKSPQQLYKEIPWKSINSDWNAAKSEVSDAIPRVYIELTVD